MKSDFCRDHLPFGANGILDSHLPAFFSSCICLLLPKTPNKEMCDFYNLFLPLKIQSKHIRILLLFTLNFSVRLSLCQIKVMVADSLVTMSSGEIVPGFPSECSSFLSISTCPEFTGSAARVRVKNSSQLAWDLPCLSSESPAAPAVLSPRHLERPGHFGRIGI